MAYTTPFLAEVVETGKLLYNTNPTSDAGRTLPIGSIRVRPIISSQRGNLSLVYARPLTLNIGTPPLNGEHVLVFPGLSVDETSGDNINASYYYFPFPLNCTDDSVINQLPDFNFQVPKGIGGGRSNLPVLPGRTFPFPVKPIRSLQPYEGDLIIQNRSGTSLRLGNGTQPSSQYAEQPEHHATPDKGSPFFSMVCDEPNPPKLRPLVEIALSVGNVMNIPGRKLLSQKYRTELLKRIRTGVYGGLSLQLPNIILARICHTNPQILGGTIEIPKYKNPQIALDSDRIVLNAKRDNAFMLARKKAIIEGEKVWLVTARHKVDVDELIDELYAVTSELNKLTSGLANFATAVGPTGPATNLAAVAAILIRILSKFRHNRPCPAPFLGNISNSPSADFGINTNNPGYGDKFFPSGGSSGQGANNAQAENDNPNVDELFTSSGVESNLDDNISAVPSSQGGIAPISELVPNSNNPQTSPIVITPQSPPPIAPPIGELVPGTSPLTPTSEEESGIPTQPNIPFNPDLSPNLGSGQPNNGGGGGGGGGISSQPCIYYLHMINSENNTWNESLVRVYVDDIIVGSYSSTGLSDIKKLNVPVKSKITLEYVKGLNDLENSYNLSLDGTLLFTDGPDPKQGIVYKHICKVGPVSLETENIPDLPLLQTPNVSKIVSLSTPTESNSPIILYELESSILNPNTGSSSVRKFILGLIITNTPMQGWHYIDKDPTQFIPTSKSLMTKDKLADIDCLVRELKNKPQCSRLVFTSTVLKKLPYTVPVS